MPAATPEEATPERRPPFQTPLQTLLQTPLQTLLRRWPTALALLLTVPGMVTGASGGSVGEDTADSADFFGEGLPLLPLLYVIVHHLGKPRLTWPVLGAGVALIAVLQVLDMVPQSVTLTVIALFVLVLGTLRGTPHRTTVFRIQAAGAFVFCAVALAGLAVDPGPGRYLVAAGWFLHGVWDFAHLRLERLDGVVSRTFAEWCGVIDVCVGIELAFLP